MIHIISLTTDRQCDHSCGCGYSEKDGKFPCGDASRLLKKLQALDNFDELFTFDGDSIRATSQESYELAVKLLNEHWSNND